VLELLTHQRSGFDTLGAAGRFFTGFEFAGFSKA
jgi:hypothetical protein